MFILYFKKMKYSSSYIKKGASKEIMDFQSSKSHYSKEQISYKVHNEAIVLPSLDYDSKGYIYGGIVDREGKYVNESACTEGRCFEYEFDKNDIVKVDKDVVFIGFFIICYGHGFTDNIKKLWWLKENNSQDFNIVYITEKNNELPEWQKRIYDLLDIDYSKWTHIKEITQFKSILVPDNSLINNNEFRIYTNEFSNLISLMKQNVLSKKYDTETYKKIYFSRSKIINYWREFGEKCIEREFQKRGYKIIYPETLSVEKQIYLMANCTEFVSTEGSCAHNSIFCNKDTKVIILRKADYANSFQLMINEIADLDVLYIDVHHSSIVNPTEPHHGPFYLTITRQLARYLGIRLYLPYWLKPSYYVYKKQAWAKYGKYFKY